MMAVFGEKGYWGGYEPDSFGSFEIKDCKSVVICRKRDDSALVDFDPDLRDGDAIAVYDIPLTPAQWACVSSSESYAGFAVTNNVEPYYQVRRLTRRTGDCLRVFFALPQEQMDAQKMYSITKMGPITLRFPRKDPWRTPNIGCICSGWCDNCIRKNGGASCGCAGRCGKTLMFTVEEALEHKRPRYCEDCESSNAEQLELPFKEYGIGPIVAVTKWEDEMEINYKDEEPSCCFFARKMGGICNKHKETK